MPVYSDDSIICEPTCTVKQFAQANHIGTGKVLQLIRNGLLKAFNVGIGRSGRPQWRIPKSAVLEFLESRTARTYRPMARIHDEPPKKHIV